MRIFRAKILLRSPVKTAVTFLLIAAASFTLIYNIADYAVTSRETEKACSFYHGVAALDNRVPDVTGTSGIYETQDKPWPMDEQIEEFSSLPGVTLADKRYMTAGLIENYKRLADQDYSQYAMGRFVIEGTYAGYQNADSSEVFIDLLFNDVVALAGDVKMDSGEPLKIETAAVKESDLGEGLEYGELPRSFFDGLSEGTRCLVMGKYNETNGRELFMSAVEPGQKAFCVLDGLGDNYIETDSFSYQKGAVEAAREDLYIYDIVYTSDMRSIPYVNERSMVITEGRPLMSGDTQACVVNELFLETYNLSVGDRVSIKFGDRLVHQDPLVGARALVGRRIPSFSDAKELEIVGAYRFTNDVLQRVADDGWSYTPNTVFVPDSLLAVEIPADYEPAAGEFSVLIENIYDVDAFRDNAEALAANMDMGLRLSDGGFMGIKDSLKKGSLASLLTAALYTAGAALALFLAVYLYIGRNKKAYAVMRLLGTPERKAAGFIALPLSLLSISALAAGSIAGAVYTSRKAAGALAGMAVNAVEHYSFNTMPPVGILIMIPAGELALVLFAALFFIRRMKNTSPLELLNEGRARSGTAAKGKQDVAESGWRTPKEFKIKELQLGGIKMPLKKKYSAIRHVKSHILRHMRRDIGKTVISVLLVIVLTAGIGVLSLTRLSYQEAFGKIEVNGKALDFSSSAVSELSKSDLTRDLYYYTNFNVRVNGIGKRSLMAFTNDFERYFGNSCTVAYAEGYDSSVFEGTGQVCLIGQTLAKELNISPGDEISLISDDLYAFMEGLYENSEEFSEAAQKAGKDYKVAGIVAGGGDVANNIFTVANSAAEALYGQPFPIRYCEFVLADNKKLEELNVMLERFKKRDMEHTPLASWHVDSEALENIRYIRDLLESFFPMAVAAVLIIGLCAAGSFIMQSVTEAAVLRIMGTTKKRIRCMLVFEQAALCFAGIVIVIIGFALYNMDLFARSIETLVICWVLYLLCSVCGAVLASVQITRYRIMELLQVKE